MMRCRKKSCRGETWNLKFPEVKLDLIFNKHRTLEPLVSKINVEFLFGKAFIIEIRERLPVIDNKLEKCVKQMKRRIHGLRLGRLLNETTIQRIDLISSGQLRYFLFKAMKLMFGNYLLTEEECTDLASTSAGVLQGHAFDVKHVETVLFKHKLQYCNIFPRKCRYHMRKRMLAVMFTILRIIFGKCFVLSKIIGDQSVVYRKDLWRNEEARGLKEREACELHGFATKRRLKMIPKHGGCRPIVYGFTAADKETMAIIRTVLETLFSSTGNIIRVKQFDQFFTNYNEFCLKWKGSSFYWATGDISDCFGSVNTTKLNMGLQSLLFPEKKFFVAKGILSKPRKRFIYRAGVNATVLQKTMQKVGAQVLYSRAISTEFIYEFLQKETFNLSFMYNKRTFKFKDGLLQGHPLSPILTEYWLMFLEAEVLSVASNNVLIQRYVDDYLLVSVKEGDLSKCLKLLTSKGILKWENVKTNPHHDGKMGSSKISWCGFDFNQENKMVSIDAERYRKKTVYYRFLPDPKQATARLAFERSANYALSHYLSIFRKCLLIYPLTKREAEIKKFLNFIYNIVFGRYVAKYRLQTKNNKTRKLMKKLIGRIARSVRNVTDGGIEVNHT